MRRWLIEGLVFLAFLIAGILSALREAGLLDHWR